MHVAKRMLLIICLLRSGNRYADQNYNDLPGTTFLMRSSYRPSLETLEINFVNKA